MRLRKTWITLIAGVMVLAVPAWVLAAGKVGIRVNGSPLDVPSYNQDGRVYAPVRAVAEALGARVDWQNGTVTIAAEQSGDPDQENRSNIRIEYLEKALLPSSPEEALSLWSDGVKTRNGALQYAVLSPQLREQKLAGYEEMFWTSGTSSPWVDHYVINRLPSAEENVQFTVAFYLASSTGAAGTETYVITTGQPSEPSAIVGNVEYWLVTGIQQQ